MVKKYLDVLEQLQFNDATLLSYKQKLLTHTYQQSTEETFSWISCVLALKAASNNNLGVGAILVKDNVVIHEACNEMLHPYFRSDGHPEMMVLSEYEATHKVTPGSMRALTLYSSLEPCPMCFTRISTTGIGAVKYIASHPGSGMVKHIDSLPILWKIFCEDLHITESTCSITLKNISREILNLTAKMQVPHILTIKEGKLPKERMANYNKYLSLQN